MPPQTPPSTPQPLTFSSLIPITPKPASTNSSSTKIYTLNLSPTFCIGTVPNGGYISSSFLLAAKQHMSSTHPKLKTVNPINLHLEFLRRTSAGPAEFLVRDLKLGARISNLHLTLRQRRDPTDETSPWQDEVEGYITLTDLASEAGQSHTTSYTLSPPAVAVDLSKLATNSDTNYIRRRKDPYGNFRRAAIHCQMHLVRPERRPSDASPAIADQWVRFRPVLERNGREEVLEGRWTNDALGYLVDIFPQLNERYVNRELEDAVLTDESVISDEAIRDIVKGKKTNKEGEGKEPPRAFWYPTLLLNLDVKKLLPEEGVEWLFVRVQAKVIRKGRFDLNVEVWDEGGEVVALSTHASLILDASRNTTRTKGKGGSKI